VAEIHDRMPVILAPAITRAGSATSPTARLDAAVSVRPDAHWPVSTRVDKPENAAAALVEPIELASDAAQLGEPGQRQRAR
jgi:putative SOS response-associated peptidase YedK